MKTQLLITSLLLVLASCKGGGSGPHDTTRTPDENTSTVYFNSTNYLFSRGESVSIVPDITGTPYCSTPQGIPAGLTFNRNNCSISGIIADHSTSGTHEVVVTSNGLSAPTSLSIGVRNILLNANSASVNKGSNLNHTISADNITLNCSLKSGVTLPAGFSLSNNCVLSGSSTTNSSTTIGINLLNNNVVIQDLSFVLNVLAPRPVLTVGGESTSSVTFRRAEGLSNYVISSDALVNGNGCKIKSGTATGLSVANVDQACVVNITSAYTMTSMAGNNITITATNEGGESDVFTLNVKAYQHHCDNEVVNSAHLVTAGFDGSSEDKPVIICSARGEIRTVQQINGTGKYFKLQEDISDVPNNSFNVAGFSGHIDGAGFAFEGNNASLPRFQTITGTLSIKNLAVRNSSVTINIGENISKGTLVGYIGTNAVVSLSDTIFSDVSVTNNRGGGHKSGLIFGSSDSNKVSVNRTILERVSFPSEGTEESSHCVGRNTEEYSSFSYVFSGQALNCTQPNNQYIVQIDLTDSSDQAYYDFHQEIWSISSGSNPTLIKKLDKVFSDGVL